MKKAFMLLSVMMILIGTLFGCSNNDVDDTSNVKPTVKIGAEATSYSNKQGNIIHETADKNTLCIDYRDEKGNVKYSEKYLYNEYGELTGFSYHSEDGSLVAKYINAGENQGFFNGSGYQITEDEFSIIMNRLGVYDY